MHLQRNYRFFILFVTSSTALCVYVFVFSLFDIIRQKGSFWDSLSKDVVSVMLASYCFISVWFVGGLSIFHFYLISTNQVIIFTHMFNHIGESLIVLKALSFFFVVCLQTTYENFRYRYEKQKNPFNEGFFKNFKDVICSKLPPPIDFREWVVVEDDDTASAVGSCTQRFGAASMRASKARLDREPSIFIFQQKDEMLSNDKTSNHSATGKD